MLSVSLSTILMASSALSTVFGASVPRALTERDIILVGANGRMEVMDKAEYQRANSQTYAPITKRSLSIEEATIKARSGSIQKRCSKETIFTVNDDVNFLGWDVPMSSAIRADNATALVAVTDGYSIANTLSVASTASFNLIDHFLRTAFTITASQTWTSSYAAAYTFYVPANKYGMVVSNPQTLRKSGTVQVGCIGEAELVDWTVDSYRSQAYGGLSWVEGTISLCTSDTYPMPMCVGEGTLS